MGGREEEDEKGEEEGGVWRACGDDKLVDVEDDEDVDEVDDIDDVDDVDDIDDDVIDDDEKPLFSR